MTDSPEYFYCRVFTWMMQLNNIYVVRQFTKEVPSGLEQSSVPCAEPGLVHN